MSLTAAHRRLDLLASPLLIVSTAILLLNDFYLKAAFPNWVTGKLSDFAGLAAFTLFFCAFRPDRRFHIAIAITTGFVFWKSPYSQPLIDWVNTASPLAISRTVDWSDLITLPIVWLIGASIPSLTVRSAPRSLMQASAIVSVFAFAATAGGGGGHPGFRETAQLRVDGTSSRTEAVLQEIVDRIAANYQLTCHICGQVTLGRVYTPGEPRSVVRQMISGNSWRNPHFLINFNPSAHRIYYEIFGSTNNDSFHASLVQEIQKAFPGTVIAPTRRPYGAEITTEIGFYKGSYRDPQYLAAHERAANVVERIMHEQGIERNSHLPLYYLPAIRIYGPRLDDWGLTVRTDPDDWPFPIRVSTASPDYFPRQKELVREIEKRLRSEFGADQVSTRCLGCPNDW